MTELASFTFDLDAHELTRLTAVLTACGDQFDLLTMHNDEVDARRVLYGSLSVEQRVIHQQLTEAGILGA